MMQHEKDIEDLDRIIDHFVSFGMSGQDMIRFFRQAIVERTYERFKGQRRTQHILGFSGTKTYYSWLSGEKKNEKTN